jgi:hypothetical protein
LYFRQNDLEKALNEYPEDYLAAQQAGLSARIGLARSPDLP